MYINIYIAISICFLLLLSLYVVVNLYRKNKIYETWLTETLNATSDIKNKWSEIDSKQMFEKDDDVGVIYEQLSQLIDNLEEKVHDE